MRCPDRYEGWEDVQHKAKLSEEEKSTIKTMQRSRGWKETVF